MSKYCKLKCFFVLFFLSSGIFNTVIAQEYHFKLEIANRSELEILTNIISIDNFDGSIITAYANEQEYQNLLKLGYAPIPIRSLKSLTQFKMMHETADTTNWNAYPTHPKYISMMLDFAIKHPNICKVDTFGWSVNGRPLLVAKISDNVRSDENEPEFFYSGQMHGDEIITYVVLLRFIDYLLSNYNSDQRIAKLIDNSEIWINPLLNPDGTYYRQDTSITQATRYNENSVDLNRNFPDPNGNDHPDGKDYQPETLALMDFAAKHNFVMSANLHSGAEVLNYPWDTWSRRAADDLWWQTVCRRYVDTVRVYAPSTYLSAENDGITNGYDWYSIHGGRQDYMNYFHHCREITLEMCNIKNLPDSLLSTYWEYNKKALLTYMEEIHRGISGIIHDRKNNPLAAKITIPGYDMDHSEVYSDSLHGIFYRLLLPGVYSLRIDVNGYQPKTINNISLNDSGMVQLNIIMNHPPQIVSAFPELLDTVMLNKGYFFKMSVNDIEMDTLTYGFIYGDSVINDTIASFSFNHFGKDSVSFFVEDGMDTTWYHWTFDVPQITSIENPLTEIKRFSLKQNYPNPFNPITCIAYEIPTVESEVNFCMKLVVYNTLGQKVRSIIKDQERSGAHSIIFNSDGLSSGIYYYKISISSDSGKTVYFSKIKKMVILK